MIRRPITKRATKLQDYKKELDGVIIYVDPTAEWCNVNTAKGVTLFQIKFDEGVAPRLRRLQQYVRLSPVPGNRTKYIITGAARRVIDDPFFAPKGVPTWDAAAPDTALWNGGWIWG
jgi:hypothetical protein